MNLYFRVLWVLIASFFRPRITNILIGDRLRFRVLPNDLDTNWHMNNSRYLTIMDLGRFDMVLRSGMMRVMLQQKSVPILSAAQIRYRLPLNPFQPYDLHTRILCWDERWFYIEQRFVLVDGPKKGAVAAIALVKGSFFNQKTQKTVPSQAVLDILGWKNPSPNVPDYVQEWIKAEDALKRVTAA